jgi:translocator protein
VSAGARTTDEGGHENFRQAVGLAVALVVCFAAAGVGSVVTAPAIPVWYAGLNKPAWTPPNWLFGPVWTLLYFAMAVAAWLVWRARGFGGAAVPLGLFALQLALNPLWSFLFFGLRSPGAALFEIVLLWLSILATALAFRRASATAALLLLPYLLWVTYAAALNFQIWRAN